MFKDTWNVLFLEKYQAPILELRFNCHKLGYLQIRDS